jgi:hypothetical protein
VRDILIKFSFDLFKAKWHHPQTRGSKITLKSLTKFSINQAVDFTGVKNPSF